MPVLFSVKQCNVIASSILIVINIEGCMRVHEANLQQS